MRLLEAFDSRATSLTVTDLSRRSGLPLSTTSRMVAELSRQGLLTRSEDGRRIQVGVRLWELASRAAPTRGLREAALPFMEDLHAVIHHHVQLGVLDGHDVLFVERLSAREAVINVTEVAGRLPLHASSSGLVLLAHAAPETQAAILDAPLRRFTPATVTSPERLRVVLSEIRKTGYAHTPATSGTPPPGSPSRSATRTRPSSPHWVSSCPTTRRLRAPCQRCARQPTASNAPWRDRDTEVSR